jgi:mRNA-degrading endonuclease toxin of MazEF toxin-antitoxin module
VGIRRRERGLRDQRQEPPLLAPVIIYKKLAHGFYFVIPTTTKSKVGSWFVPFRHAEREMVASLHQARAIDHRRLSTKLGQLDDNDFDRAREGFWKLYK